MTIKKAKSILFGYQVELENFLDKKLEDDLYNKTNEKIKAIELVLWTLNKFETTQFLINRGLKDITMSMDVLDDLGKLYEELEEDNVNE